MNHPRIVIEARFSIERRRIEARIVDMTSPTEHILAFLPESGTLLLANPREQLSVRASGDAEDLMVVRLAPALLVETAARLRLHRVGAHLLFRQTLEKLEAGARIRSMLETIEDEIAGGAPGWREVIGSLIQQLAIHLLRAHVDVRRADDVELSRVGMVDRRLRRAIEFMHDNCGRELRLGEIAGVAYLSPFHFARLFKKIVGVPPHAYLAALRIERARRLLAETDLSISEVGARVGYEHQSHFTKIFRAATGLAPRAFRAAAMENARKKEEITEQTE
ncbi:MAG: AraC family transcriptional regulator [Acidobacteria bacterium]|nr:AraC family transcriptional regulator [Acidobacteriota bacterium]